MDIPGLWVGNIERVVATVAIAMVDEIVTKREDVIHKARLELLHITLPALSTPTTPLINFPRLQYLQISRQVEFS